MPHFLEDLRDGFLISRVVEKATVGKTTVVFVLPLSPDQAMDRRAGDHHGQNGIEKLNPHLIRQITSGLIDPPILSAVLGIGISNRTRWRAKTKN